MSRKNLKPKKNKNDELKKSLKSYAKYSSLAFQMGAIIFLGTWGGYKLDEYLNPKSKIFTVIFALLSVFIAIYYAIKDFIKK